MLHLQLPVLSESRFALVFPGQGSQYVGMGKAIYEASQAARRIFQQADEVLGFALSRLCFEGPAEELNDTINAQPAILTVSVAYLAALKEWFQELGHSITPAFVAGHSLGEYSALVAAGVLDFPDALRLVRERGRLMKESGDQRPGGMAAVLGMDQAVLRQVCARAAEHGVVVLANDNCPDQTVISGERPALERALQLIREAGARAIPLNISIASHSPLMQQAAEQLSVLLSSIHIRDPQVPIVANIAGQILTSAEEIRRELSQQLCLPVEWTRSVGAMLERGIDTFIEVGPGQVLSRLIRRISPDVSALSLG